MDEGDVEAGIADHAWYHRIGLGPQLVTPGVERYQAFQRPVLDELEGTAVAGRRLLDVGCRDGLVAFAAERLGAREVVGVDNNLSTGATGLVIPATGSAVRMVEANILDVGPADLGGPFDVVVAAGLLYHLREPFRGLRTLAALVTDGGVLVLETAILLGGDRWADLWCPTGTDGPYDATSPSFFNRKGLVDTLHSLGLAVESWRPLGAAVHHPRSRRARLLRRTRRVDRVTVRCRLDPAADAPELEAYWYGHHATRRWS